MVSERCAFTTERLLVREWHSVEPEEWPAGNLDRFVASLLTPAVTAALPAEWQGEYGAARVRSWIRDRDREGATLVAIERSGARAVGLVILHETDRGPDSVDIRLGYVLQEAAWGRGLASELVSGFVGWCRECRAVRSLAAGVEPGNDASVRVLEKSGFRPLGAGPGRAGEDQIYELEIVG